MNKDVLITIKGLQYALADNEDQRIETINRGTLAVLNGKSVVSYEEAMEGSTSTTKNLIKFDKNIVEVTKRGDFSVHMVFEEGKKNLTSYSTPFGNLIVGIDTHSILLNEKEKNTVIKVEYDMDINYEHVASCTIDIDIKEV